MLVIACKLNLHVCHVESTFLYGEICDEVYMSLPGDTKHTSSTVCKLSKSIYGLKRPPRCWNIKFDNVMRNENFVRSDNDYCLKISNESMIFVLLYVDDVLILGTTRK